MLISLACVCACACVRACVRACVCLTSLTMKKGTDRNNKVKNITRMHNAKYHADGSNICDTSINHNPPSSSSRAIQKSLSLKNRGEAYGKMRRNKVSTKRTYRTYNVTI